MWDAAKTVFREIFIALNEYIRKEERSKFNNLSFYLGKCRKKRNLSLKHAEEINKQKNNRNKDFPGGTVVKNLSTNAGNMGSSPGPGRSHMPQSN